MRDWTSLGTGDLFVKFQGTGREPLRLEIALHAFFLPETPPEQRAVYEQYLRRRIRPAAEAAMETEDVDTLEAFERLGWLEDDKLDGLIRLAREKRRTATLIWLLRLKAERGCYHDRDYAF